MSVTSSTNEAKNDLDIILGEIQRLSHVLASTMTDEVGESLDVIAFKAKKIRASL